MTNEAYKGQRANIHAFMAQYVTKVVNETRAYLCLVPLNAEQEKKLYSCLLELLDCECVEH